MVILNQSQTGLEGGSPVNDVDRIMYVLGEAIDLIIKENNLPDKEEDEEEQTSFPERNRAQFVSDWHNRK